MPRDGHYITRSNWLRAAVLGANDGIVSTASLLVGVAAAGLTRETVVLTGLAGLTAGALSMASGEYVSVSAQADVEAADLERERVALEEDPDYELDELTEGLEARGVETGLARQVAEQMTDHDALGAHAREELGLFGLEGNANPLQAALAPGVAFALGGGIAFGGGWAGAAGVCGGQCGCGGFGRIGGLGGRRCVAGGIAQGPFNPPGAVLGGCGDGHHICRGAAL